jgi:hypothetical protein
MGQSRENIFARSGEAFMPGMYSERRLSIRYDDLSGMPREEIGRGEQ